ncbi:MAG: hypothetical protein KDA21_01340 [Phycisphaerales bacterium]|nr:hypothetical protein [Phycisphaerales bacterium]
MCACDLRTAALALTLGLVFPAATLGNDDPELPFDFSDAFYLENGIDPEGVIGRQTGAPPNSVIDNTPNGPDFNNVRLLSMAAAYDHSGHLIFFYVPGILSEASFTPDSAGAEAREIADAYKVYEFPRADNPLGAVFPKRQDLIADLRHGYFSNNPLGIWQVNLIRFTEAAFTTADGLETLADLADRNGLDLDGTPIIRTHSEVEMLLDRGFASNFIPPADGSQGLRWFLCPVLEDPRDGAIAPDSFLAVTEGIEATREFEDAFHCLQTTGDWCDDSEGAPPAAAIFCPGDADGDTRVDFADLNLMLEAWQKQVGQAGYVPGSDIDNDGAVTFSDLNELLFHWDQACN